MVYRKLVYNLPDNHNFILASDLHWGANNFDYKLFGKMIEIARAENARVFINGDIFDAILPGDKKRWSPSVFPVSVDAYINEIMDKATEDFLPLADYIDWVGYGNHEESIIKYHGFDMLQELVRRLNAVRAMDLPPIVRGGYSGFIDLAFTRPGATGQTKVTVYHNHGTGGGAPMTKGMLTLSRAAMDVFADVYWFGHIHKMIFDAGSSYVVCAAGRITKRKRYPIITGCMKDLQQTEDHDLRFSDKFVGAESTGFALMSVRRCTVASEALDGGPDVDGLDLDFRFIR